MKKNFRALNFISACSKIKLRTVFIATGLSLASIEAQAQCLPGNPCNFLTKLGGIVSVNGAEISAFDPGSNRVFTVAGPIIEYYTLSNTGTLLLAGSLPYGFTPPAGQTAIPNSVAVYNGILAVSYAVATIPVPPTNPVSSLQHPGRVTFYNAATGLMLNSVVVGYLPDMITFTPDGSKILTADEGEPSGYGPGTFDPEGSVSIIDISGGVVSATVQIVSFAGLNGQMAALKAAGVRIYGPNATVAQDLEPEYIALSPDGNKAWVTLQENNAIAIIDIATATVQQIIPLGLKDHSKPTVTGLQTFAFNSMPVLGVTAGGQNIPLGGFSGLSFEGYAANGNLKFITHTDRGPNGEPTGINRPFALPGFAPEIIRFELNRSIGQITITQRIQLRKTPAQLLSGLPNTGFSGDANLPYNDEVPVDLNNNVLGLDPLGADLEGIIVVTDGSFWMVDEYRPAIYHFDASGLLLKRFVPAGTAAAAGQPAGTFGIESLPAIIANRRQNRGFEGIAFQNGKLYAFVQSPIRNPSSLSTTTLNGMKNIRIVEFDPVTETTTGQYIYIMDNADLGTPNNTRPDKIGDAVAIANGEFLALERDDDAIDSDPITNIEKKIYRFSLSGATKITTANDILYSGKTLDQMTASEMTTAGISPIVKYLHVDLATAGYNTTEKVEGLTMVDCNTLAVINDNDFTVGGLAIAGGLFTPFPNPNGETPLLGLIGLRNNGMDANDRDVNGTSGGGGKISIRHWPVMGMYQPDAIAHFTVAGQTYYITANEGDARDWPGYAEEIRVGAGGYGLDATVFPNASLLKRDSVLGRLQLTNATGSTDADAQFEQIHALGARSFSIWNSNGVQVYDSGDELEQITAALVPSIFNSDGSFGPVPPANFDSRSDNKGPETEAVTIGIVNNVPYAFVGLERTGDIVVYDVSNPLKPVFKQYINTPEDLGVEGLIFVSAANSPTGRPLLISSAEVSRTVTVYEINAPTCSITAVPNNNTYTGGIVTNLYLGYGPDKLTLNVSTVPPAGAPYTYSWSGGPLSNYNTVNPVFTATEAGSYTFTVEVRSQCGIVTTCSITICVTDIRVVGQKGKVYICHAPPDNPANQRTHAISVNAVPEHLLSHPDDRLGKCEETPCGLIARSSQSVVEELVTGLVVKAYPNPSNNYFTLDLKSDKNEPLEITVMDMLGRKLYSETAKLSGRYSFGHQFVSGTYIVEVRQGDRREILKLTKQ